jgi:hypothetical protein
MQAPKRSRTPNHTPNPRRLPIDQEIPSRFAIIERAQDFTLVPWRPVLERAKGQSVSGIVGR